jgi:tRNA 2-thiocytidine biosynthesis protein TtcA
MKRVLGHLRRADEENNMISNGDTIAVGVSGGKDSMVLVKALQLYKNFAKVKFDVVAVTVDLGFDGYNVRPIEEYCKSLDVPFVCVKTHIGKIIFDERQEQNPCSLCSKLRKGALFTELKRQGVKKCAFGHHRDDVLETLLMSMFYEGRIRTFKPVTYLDRMDVTLIRPLIYLAEHEIVSTVKRHDIPVVKSPCPACGTTKRQETKELLSYISKSNPKARDIMLTALKNKDQYSLWDKS